MTVILQGSDGQYHTLRGVSVDGLVEGADIFYRVMRDGVALVDLHVSQIDEVLFVLTCRIDDALVNEWKETK